jgi:PKD repeat protein
VSNVGGADLLVGTITLTGTNADQFAIQNDNASGETIAPAGSRTLQVVFSPTSVGAKSAALSIPSNDPDEPTVTVPLSGVGVAAEPDISVSPPSKDFGDVLVGSSSPAQTFTVSNVGGADLDVYTITITGTNANQFAKQNDNVSGETIAPGGSRTVQVVFGPTSAGAKVAALSIPSNDPDEPTVTVSLTGVGVVPEPDISVSPTSKNFGDVAVGSSSSAQTFTVRNVGNADLDVYTITITGTNANQFSKQNDNVSGETIAPGGSRTLRVVFSPTSVGAKSAALSIPSNDPDEDPLTVPLSGSGVACKAEFSGSPRTGMAPLRVSFTDESTGAIDTWLWEFGDGKTSDEESPVHTYVAPGYYDVKLTASAPGGSCSETKLHYIAVVMEEPGLGAPIFSVSNLYISPEQAQPNQQVEISVNIGNIGGATGTYSAALYINGQLENSETVSVGAGSTREVVFTVTRADAGTYEVSFAGLQGQFTVVSTPVLGTGLGTAGIVAIIVVAIVLIAAVVYLLRRRT